MSSNSSTTASMASSPPSPSSSPAPEDTPSHPPPLSTASPPSPQSMSPPAPPTDTPSSAPPSNSGDSSPPPEQSHGSLPSLPSPPSSVSSKSSGGGSEPAHASARHVSSTSMSDIIFAAVGAAVLLVLLIAACFCCSRRRRRRKKPHNPMQYYADNSGSGYKGNSTYYTSGPQPQWQRQEGPATAMSSFGPPGGTWHMPSTPPPPDMSSGAYAHGQPLPLPSPNESLGLSTGTFTYEELAAATGNFSQANLLGQGGFGYVHKGVLPGGKVVAVKQLKSGSGQGEREFQAEVDIISRVHHRHLVSLVGYCIAGDRRMLVYEFVPNKTLEHQLHGKGVPAMDWTTRLRIALGSAKGLAYLHEDCHPRIIHRDIKSANILLDDNFEAMVADFGLAKLTSDNKTHVSTRVMGTFGYLAPEYASSGKLTEKSDVFSYGVMLLELLTGRRPVDTSHAFMEDSLVDWARPVLSRALTDGNYDDVADPKLEGNYDPMEMARMAASAAACVRHSARKRPKMSQIVRALEGNVSLEDLNEGVRPGQSVMFGSAASECSHPGSYTSNMNRIRQVAMATPDYSGPIPEFSSDESFPVSDDDVKQRHRAHQ